jgi:hypothetical protein
VPDITFGMDGKAVFPTKYHGQVTLSEAKWNLICSQPERAYYRYNGEKIGTTLINPDEVRHHAHEKKQFLYYKKFLKISVNEGVEMTRSLGVYFAVIIDTESGKVCTVYPVLQPKPGKVYKLN